MVVVLVTSPTISGCCVGTTNCCVCVCVHVKWMMSSDGGHCKTTCSPLPSSPPLLLVEWATVKYQSPLGHRLTGHPE